MRIAAKLSPLRFGGNVATEQSKAGKRPSNPKASARSTGAKTAGTKAAGTKPAVARPKSAGDGPRSAAGKKAGAPKRVASAAGRTGASRAKPTQTGASRTRNSREGERTIFRLPRLFYREGPRFVSEEEARHVREVMHRSIIGAVISTFFLLVLGVVMVYSATTPSSIRALESLSEVGAGAFRVANQHMILALAGVLLAIFAAWLPVQLYLLAANVLFGLGLLLQSLIFVTSGGSAAGGNMNWLIIGSFRFQPSEFLKLATIVWLAAWLSQLRSEQRSIRDFMVPAGLGAVASLLLVLAGGDLGTGLIFMMFIAGMAWLANIPWKYLGSIALVGVVGVVGLVLTQRSRTGRFAQYFAHLFGDPNPMEPTQPDFALWAFGSGGLGGSGLGTGAEKWPGNLAEAQTDYIFAVVGEELGLLGCLVVVGMFCLLGWSLFQICRYHPSPFARLVVGGIGIWLVGQAMANMMVVTALLPVFGVPLPFMSQGGTAAIACLLAVGVCISAARAVPGVKESFQVRSNLAYRARAVLKRGSRD